MLLPSFLPSCLLANGALRWSPRYTTLRNWNSPLILLLSLPPCILPQPGCLELQTAGGPFKISDISCVCSYLEPYWPVHQPDSASKEGITIFHLRHRLLHSLLVDLSHPSQICELLSTRQPFFHFFTRKAYLRFCYEKLIHLGSCRADHRKFHSAKFLILSFQPRRTRRS